MVEVSIGTGKNRYSLDFTSDDLAGCCAYHVLHYPHFRVPDNKSDYGTHMVVDGKWKEYEEKLVELVRKLAQSTAITKPVILTDSINQPGVKYAKGPFVKDIIEIIKKEGLGALIATRGINNPKGEHRGSIVRLWVWLTPKILKYNQEHNENWNDHTIEKSSRGSESGGNDGTGRVVKRAGFTGRSRIRRTRTI